MVGVGEAARVFEYVNTAINRLGGSSNSFILRQIISSRLGNVFSGIPPVQQTIDPPSDPVVDISVVLDIVNLEKKASVNWRQ